jgi:hypothetical protein
MAGLYSSKKENEFQAQLASLGLAVEALETILVEQGVLRDGQIMEEALKIAARKMQMPGLEESPIILGPEKWDG